MRSRRILLGVAMAVIAASAFTATWAKRSATTAATTRPVDRALLDWLDVSADSRDAILRHDLSFSDDLQRLREELAARREELAAVLETPDSSDDLVRQKVQAVNAASAAIENRVAEHLLAIRDHLSPAQQKRLMNLCAMGVRQGPGWRWRHGQSGTGGGPGRGGGMGGGMGYRGGR